MTPADTRVGWGEVLSPAFLARAMLVLLGVWLNAADTLVTATLMPSVARSIHAFAGFGLAVAGYLTGAIVAGASAGRLSERTGLKPAMVLAGVTYSVGCLMSAIAGGLDLFVGGRIVQGVGAGWIVGFCYVAIGQVFPERLWPRMFGLMSGVWGVASLLGPLVGGVFASLGLWRGAFWMFLAQGLIFAAAAIALVPQHVVREASSPHTPWKTLGVLTLSVSAIAAAGVLSHASVAAMAALAGLAMLIVAARVNAASHERLLPAEATQIGTVAGAGYASTFSLSAAGAVLTVYGAAMLQAFYGLSPLTAGYVIAAEAMGWTVAAILVSGVSLVRYRLLIRAGAGLVVTGVALIAICMGRAPLPVTVGAVLVQGTGFGLCWSLITAQILRALPVDDLAIGSSAVPTSQIIGGAVGAAAAGALANLLGLAHAFAPSVAHGGEPWLFGAFVAPAILGLCSAVRLTARDRPE
ncbi:MAG: MFS transporter [Caulobacteraceae bacterium]|nr:MFS transporter [Caulobacteraceae bacterium]